MGSESATAPTFPPSVCATAVPSLKPEVNPAPKTASELLTDDSQADLMTSASEDAAARPSSPPDLRMTRSEECFGSPSKRESAKSGKKARSRPSPEMGMRPHDELRLLVAYLPSRTAARSPRTCQGGLLPVQPILRHFPAEADRPQSHRGHMVILSLAR